MSDYSKELKARRLAAGLTQRELAIKMGLDPYSGPVTVSRWETGARIPRESMRRLIDYVLTSTEREKQEDA